MENNKFWVYLCLGVVAALSLKWFSSSDSSVTSKRWSMGANMSEEIQYKRSAKAHTKVAGLYERRTTKLASPIKSGATTAAPAAAAKKDVKLQNVAKKKDDKKKKKKKNKKPNIMGVPETDSLNNDDSDETLEARNSNAAGAQAPLAFQGGAAKSAAPANPLSEWERILLVTANHRETTRFIGLYQTRQITAEVFYGIVGQMTNDGRTQMRQLGLMSLAATPSTQSYEMLVTMNESETGSLKSQTTRVLEETYNRPQAIGVIYAVLKSEVSVAVQLQALNNLSAIISKQRVPSSQPETTVDSGTDSVEQKEPTKKDLATQKSLIEYFRRIRLDAMPSLLQSKDQRVQALAQTVSGLLLAALNSPAQPTGQLAAVNGNN